MDEREISFRLPSDRMTQASPQRPAARSAAARTPYRGKTGRQRRRVIVMRRVTLLLGMVALICLLGVLTVRFAAERIAAAAVDEYPPAAYDLSGYVFDPADPLLLVVNANLPLAAEYTFEPTQADPATGAALTGQAASAYQQMASAALANGVELTLVTGYMDASAQQAAFDQWVGVYKKRGLSDAEAEANAATIVPRPGCNEHATGLAADILTPDYTEMDTGFAETQAYAWLCRYAPDYGFVLRYPENSQPATGMVFQPWHWRYVGVENARAITQSGLSLEEFVALNKAALQ